MNQVANYTQGQNKTCLNLYLETKISPYISNDTSVSPAPLANTERCSQASFLDRLNPYLVCLKQYSSQASSKTLNSRSRKQNRLTNSDIANIYSTRSLIFSITAIISVESIDPFS